MTNITQRALFLLLFFLIPSCGYETAQRGVSYEDEVLYKVAVPTFKNKTLNSGVGVGVTKAIRQNVINNGIFDLYSLDDADLIIEGKVTNLTTTVYALNNIGSATEYRLKMTLRFEVKDKRNPTKSLFSDVISGTWDYKVAANTLDNRLAKNEAMANLSNQLAQEILFLIQERFAFLPQN